MKGVGSAVRNSKSGEIGTAASSKRTSSASKPSCLQYPHSSASRSRAASANKREPLLTLNEVAEILKVSVKQVRRYITDPDRRKRLRSIKVGRLIRIDPFDLEDFIRDHRCP
jgi:excisionase family DNA binding protein